MHGRALAGRRREHNRAVVADAKEGDDHADGKGGTVCHS